MVEGLAHSEKVADELRWAHPAGIAADDGNLDRSPVGRARKIREAAELRRRRSATTSGGQWRWVLVACGLWWPEVAHGCEGAACGV